MDGSVYHFSSTENMLLGGEEARNGKSCRTSTPGKLGEIGLDENALVKDHYAEPISPISHGEQQQPTTHLCSVKHILVLPQAR
jgi:hypothetical protein